MKIVVAIFVIIGICVLLWWPKTSGVLPNGDVCNFSAPQNHQEQKYVANCIKELSKSPAAFVYKSNSKCNSTITIFGDEHVMTQKKKEKIQKLQDEAARKEIYLVEEDFAFDEVQATDFNFGVNGENSWVLQLLLHYLAKAGVTSADLNEMLHTSPHRSFKHFNRAWKNCGSDKNFSENTVNGMIDYYVNISTIPQSNRHDIQCYRTFKAKYHDKFLQSYSQDGVREQEMAQNLKRIFDTWACPNNKDIVAIVGASHRGLVQKIQADASIRFFIEEPFVRNVPGIILKLCDANTKQLLMTILIPAAVLGIMLIAFLGSYVMKALKDKRF